MTRKDTAGSKSRYFLLSIRWLVFLTGKHRNQGIRCFGGANNLLRAKRSRKRRVLKHTFGTKADRGTWLYSSTLLLFQARCLHTAAHSVTIEPNHARMLCVTDLATKQLQDFLFENTAPFLHELWCFRWSKAGMRAYDGEGARRYPGLTGSRSS